ncbi:MAG: TetR/AcrR family transcriptional regulator [Solirubrobacteraceae bacterium]
MPPTAPVRRKPQSPAESEREIVAAADKVLRERPFHELTVDAIMRETGLKRPSFYVHFRDRNDVILRVVGTIGDELFDAAGHWYRDESDPVSSARRALEGVVAVYSRHGPVLRAVADAATDDADVERAYLGLVRRFADAAADHIRKEQRAGRALAVDPDPTAEALTWLTERYLSQKLGRGERPDSSGLVDVLLTIWLRSLYGDRSI